MFQPHINCSEQLYPSCQMLSDKFSQEQSSKYKSQASTKSSESYHKTQSQKVALGFTKESSENNGAC